MLNYKVNVYTGYHMRLFSSDEYKTIESAMKGYNSVIRMLNEEAPLYGGVVILYENSYPLYMAPIRGMESMTKVRKYGGGYRVYFVQRVNRYPFFSEFRFNTLKDAEDFAQRNGGHAWGKDFATREEAQKYLDESPGVTWW